MWSKSEWSSREEKTKGEREDKTKGQYIPEGSVYDEQPTFAFPRGSSIPQKAVTVFGYSASNLEHVLRKFREIGEIKDLSYGKNWIDIKYEKEKCMFLALRESGVIINGEMIGVVQKARKNTAVGRVENTELFLKKDVGLLGRVLTYLFG